jgi:hypothetical protein
MDDNGGDGLSGFGNFMLLVGIIGVIGFFLVLMSAGQ